jgi:transposase-like protein
MEQGSIVVHFFSRRWPHGFQCPRCGHSAYYVIATRRLPLYQCRFCKHQTNVAAGTLMDKSRTPLVKWNAAIEALSASSGLNGKQLADAIGVTHKVAWTMLRKFRSAIQRVEEARKLEGTIHAGLQALAPSSIFVFLPHKHYRSERVVSVCASVNASGNPTSLKMKVIPRSDLIPRWKELSRYGQSRLIEEIAIPEADATWLNDARMHLSPLQDCFEEAKEWLKRLFNGVGSRYLQCYLDEYTFRWNAAANGISLEQSLFEHCIHSAETPTETRLTLVRAAYPYSPVTHQT